MMLADTITLTFSREDLACLNRIVASEALVHLGHAMRGTLRDDENPRKDRLVALSDKLATAQRNAG